MTSTSTGPGAGRIYTGHREAMTSIDWQRLGWDATAADRYAAAFVGSAVRVFVVDEHGARPLTHHVRHSPSGFAWGYGGSGPAELARCVLLDFYDIGARDAADEWESPLPVSYQQFKFDVIAGLPQDLPWTISGRQIADWAASTPA
ncbi:MAG TPA: DUF6166 domain-containing protein [Solirubrobacteraceae bacterium]|jgi:hypothetical protein|nr:DUF6166 domain-containing protein [Solirubrobacteraceae bacterium]